jgi:hypothetical protein
MANALSYLFGPPTPVAAPAGLTSGQSTDQAAIQQFLASLSGSASQEQTGFGTQQKLSQILLNLVTNPNATSPAQTQLQETTSANEADQQAQAAAAGGGPLARRNAAYNTAMLTGKADLDAAILRGKETEAAAGEAGQVAGAEANEGAQMYGTNTSAAANFANTSAQLARDQTQLDEYNDQQQQAYKGRLLTTLGTLASGGSLLGYSKLFGGAGTGGFDDSASSIDEALAPSTAGSTVSDSDLLDANVGGTAPSTPSINPSEYTDPDTSVDAVSGGYVSPHEDNPYSNSNGVDAVSGGF